MTLNFLLKLHLAELPLRVDSPDEIRLVTVHKATGLIEAEIQPLSDPAGTYVKPQFATVICITDEGLAELAVWVGQMCRKPHRP